MSNDVVELEAASSAGIPARVSQDPAQWATSLIASGWDPLAAFLRVGYDLEQIAAAGYDVSQGGVRSDLTPERTADRDRMLEGRLAAQLRFEGGRAEARSRSQREETRTTAAGRPPSWEAQVAEIAARLRPPSLRAAPVVRPPAPSNARVRVSHTAPPPLASSQT